MKKHINLILFVFNVAITIPFLVINNLVPITFFENGIFFIIWNIIVVITFVFVLYRTIKQKSNDWIGWILLICTGLLIIAFIFYWGFWIFMFWSFRYGGL
jgi:hypothetical protein